MAIWQSDLWRVPDSLSTEVQWLLLICDRKGNSIHEAKCLQSEVNSQWLKSQLEVASQHSLPEKIQIFRPQITGLFGEAAAKLNITLEVTRRTPQIKQKIRKYIEKYYSVRSGTNYLALDRPPPQNLPEEMWGENWTIISICAGDLIDFATDRPLPVCDLPESLVATNARLALEIKIPGIVVDGGRKSLQLVQWIQQVQPVALNYISTEIGKSGGLILETGLVDRWIFATFESATVAPAVRNYEQAKKDSLGLHFLLVRPDDSGMTYTGFWLLRDE